ncbi:hypothetical protein GCM10018790_71400 [Kitasatospora xanthocidica]|nr:hypothetical protein GCM10018790_71400 [Kitasatospora xanthocidica]
MFDDPGGGRPGTLHTSPEGERFNVGGKFFPAGGERGVSTVSCTIHDPVPEGRQAIKHPNAPRTPVPYRDESAPHARGLLGGRAGAGRAAAPPRTGASVRGGVSRGRGRAGGRRRR